MYASGTTSDCRMEQKTDNDPMGHAIADYWSTGKADRLRVLSPLFDEDEIPVPLLFRSFEDMPLLEQKALRMTRGRTLDVGSGAGCHALWLQEQGIDVTALDISSLAVQTMLQRGLSKVVQGDFFDLDDGPYDTILMLMNGIGIVGTLNHMPRFFAQLDRLVAPQGKVLCDSSDICYVFENEEGVVELPDGDGYYGELTYEMRYRNTRGKSFPWLYIDFETLQAVSAAHGYRAELLCKGPHYDYLACISRNQN